MVFTSSEPAGVLYMTCAGTKLCCPDTRGLRTTAWVTLVPEEDSKPLCYTHQRGFLVVDIVESKMF